MKAILMSIKPRHNKNILNLIKLWEIRKKFPKDYVGLVYIYVTKDNNNLLHKNCANIWWVEDKDFQKKNKRLGIEQQPIYNGKVVARFWCDKVEEIKYHFGYYDMGEWTESYILENSCLTAEELDNYLQASKEYDEKKVSRVYGQAIHIQKVEIFNQPKELKDFLIYSHTVSGIGFKGEEKQFKILKPLTRAPQSWCYIEDVL